MLKGAAILAAAALCCPVIALAQEDTVAVEQTADNAEMAEMFAQDQSARSTPGVDWTVVAQENAQRRARTRELLDAGELRTGQDYWHAAFIFQHGSEPRDYLLAHALAVHAIGLGH
ncbi:hypothetical protein [Aurantiacibacter gangjinensis]|uniref:hypothetical protein n=1 Tax=Aurantiacibacter gangjinensis TaxID=502682 RepID=UPI0006995A99|nr:hypothetical protein [Aurantiacibacter gangjinensis]APE29008.1 putative lipoprotein [Aurantiacibacter gangjinensis]